MPYEGFHNNIVRSDEFSALGVLGDQNDQVASKRTDVARQDLFELGNACEVFAPIIAMRADEYAKLLEKIKSEPTQDKDQLRRNYEEINRYVLEKRVECLRKGYLECFGFSPLNEFLYPDFITVSKNLCKRLKSTGFM